MVEKLILLYAPLWKRSRETTSGAGKRYFRITAWHSQLHAIAHKLLFSVACIAYQAAAGALQVPEEPARQTCVKKIFLLSRWWASLQYQQAYRQKQDIKEIRRAERIQSWEPTWQKSSDRFILVAAPKQPRCKYSKLGGDLLAAKFLIDDLNSRWIATTSKR